MLIRNIHVGLILLFGGLLLIATSTDSTCSIHKCHDIYREKQIVYHGHLPSNISRTLVGNNIVDHSDVVGASPIGAAPTTSSLSTYHMASVGWTPTTARRVGKYLGIRILCGLYERLDGTYANHHPPPHPRPTNRKNLTFLVSSCSCFYPNQRSQLSSREWRCSRAIGDASTTSY